MSLFHFYQEQLIMLQVIIEIIETTMMDRTSVVRPASSLTRREAFMMLSVNNGQCGLCSHFGEDHLADPKLAQIRQTHTAPDDMLDDCGHPRHASLHLKVTPISGCDGFEPAARPAKAN